MTRRPKLTQATRVEFDARAAGAECGTCPFNALGAKPCQPRGGSGALVVVESYPSAYDDKMGKAVPSTPRRFLSRTLADAGATEYVSTFATLCRPPKDSTDAHLKEAIAACRPRLGREVVEARKSSDVGGDQWILALGQEAFSATTGKSGSMQAWVGSPVASCFAGAQTITTWDPGYILSKPGRRYAPLFARFTERAVKFSDGGLHAFQWQETVVDDCEAALRRVLAVVAAGGEYGFDIEATGLDFERDRPTCLGFAIADLAVSVQLPATPVVDALCRDILRQGVMVAQNGEYDRRMMRQHGYEITPKFEELMVAHLILEPQHQSRKLGWQAAAELHSSAWKSEFRLDDAGNMVWSEGTPEEERQKRIYNACDAWVTFYLWQSVYKPRLDAYK